MNAKPDRGYLRIEAIAGWSDRPFGVYICHCSDIHHIALVRDYKKMLAIVGRSTCVAILCPLVWA